MIVRRALLMSALLLLPTPFPAQARAASAGPLKGKWGGTLGGGVADGTPATMELAVDARGALTGMITGPKLTPGDAKGNYDAKTGAVKFVVTLRDGGGTFDFTGAIVKDTLKAQTSGDGGRLFTMRLVRGMKAPALPSSAGPQQPSDAALAAARRSFTEVSGWVSRAASLVPAEKYSYRPAASVRTFGQLVGHLADSYAYYCSRASGKEAQWSDAIEKGTTDKSALAAKLKQAQDACGGAYTNGQIGALIENVGHTNLHYGNMVTYMRMMGLTPPSS